MKKLKLFGIITVILMAGVALATAGSYYHHGGGMAMKNMDKMDGNNDDLITFEEFSAPQMDTLRSAFAMIDTNNDEVIDADEWNAFLALHGYDTGVETN